MCGISGFVNKQGHTLKELENMNDLVRHRGPDDEGFMVFNNQSEGPHCLRGKDSTQNTFETTIPYRPTGHIHDIRDKKYRVALGHRRLSILDLSNFGHQPMCTPNGRFWIIYNGEIYNFKELRADLTKEGYKFITSTDTEVILAAYEEWGENCLDKFNGMWAFVIYDLENDEIFMARDRYGIKPFYYWIAPSGTLFFGSEIKQFTACSGWQARLNGQRAYDYLVYSLTDHTDETMFTGVFHLPPGHFFKSEIDNIDLNEDKRLDVTKWYQIEKQQVKQNLAEASTEFKLRFKDAVKLHLRADVPVGSALSGGLDSSAIVCEINNLLKENGRNELQKTFSSCDTDKRYDEREWMDIVIDQTNVDAHFVYPGYKEASELTSKIIWHQDEPYQSQSAFLGFQVFALARQNNVKVLLNGQGADEYLGGYSQLKPIFLKNLLKRLRFKVFLNNINSNGNQAISTVIKQMLHPYLPGSLKNIVTKWTDSEGDARNFVSVKKLNAKDLHPFNESTNNPKTVLDTARFFMLFSPLPKYLRWEDRNSMAHSVEARVPFLDHRLVELCANQPVENLHSNNTTKLILRRGLEDILPVKIKNRKDKKGFITPEERWVKENYTSVIRKQLEEAIKNTGGIIKPNALTYFDQMAKGELPFDYTYWRLILFNEWVKCFDVKIQ